ncbi:sensory box histidine kinase/response regulator [Enhygromyxa salina]|uniref:Sensory box histidine kinase/response regulator n=1 Tax=Enhygromyxa salina TaxID=215803 RepID=A0A0C2CWH0_9BACT|nr:sensory box histidine kinase/response regulator [Enhygromyxa salina]
MLVVDDEPAVRKIAERVLQRISIEVVTANDGEQALAQLAEHPDIGLILLDATLPDMHADRLLDLMRARGFTTPVLLSSGFGEDCLPGSEEFPNVRGFLPKPYSVATLSERVQKLLEPT